MKNKIYSLITVGLLTIVITGCASIVGGGSTQEVNFDSNPAGAEIWMGQLEDEKVVNLVNSGNVTPSNVIVNRKNVVVILKKEGYEDTNVVMMKTMNGWFWGNIIIGGLLGSSIDSSTGAMHKFDPNNFFLEMKEK